MMHAGAAMLTIENLNKSFDSLVVSDNLGFELAAGQALGIIGPNGAGKSTLLNLISGVLKPDSGLIRLDGHDITHASPQARCRTGIGRTFQIPHPFGNLTVFENVLVAAVYGTGKRESQVVASCGDILERTQLMALADRRAETLTLLERKRLELARALATEPRLLLLDEIAGGLTEAECAVLVSTVRDIHAQGIAIIWIEHIVHALLAVVGRLLVLNFGRKIAEGEPSAVMALPDVQEIYLGIAA
jgi:branched-chain amino acid transport system ATP-binding protein